MARTVALLIGTKRGLFIARSDERRESWTLTPPLLAGREVYHALIDPRDGRTAWAATRHTVWGAHVHRSDDAGATWQVLEAAPHHADERGLEAVWCIAPGPPSQPDVVYAGIEPAGLFVSRDRGESWTAVASLNEHPTRTTWQPAGGALALHSIHAYEGGRILCALSAGGVYRSDDGGANFAPKNARVRASFLPRPFPATGQCVHKLIAHPAKPDRLYQQNHCGVYRSEDAGDTWTEITSDLPSDFGYVLALDPRDPDTAFVVPEHSSEIRTVLDGKLRVYRTRDAGASWQPLKRGLPQENAWVSLLREAMSADGLDPLGVYFGTSSGHVFASRNGGESWALIAGFLPRIVAVGACLIDG